MAVGVAGVVTPENEEAPSAGNGLRGFGRARSFQPQITRMARMGAVGCGSGLSSSSAGSKYPGVIKVRIQSSA